MRSRWWSKVGTGDHGCGWKARAKSGDFDCGGRVFPSSFKASDACVASRRVAGNVAGGKVRRPWSLPCRVGPSWTTRVRWSRLFAAPPSRRSGGALYCWRDCQGGRAARGAGRLAFSRSCEDGLVPVARFVFLFMTLLIRAAPVFGSPRIWWTALMAGATVVPGLHGQRATGPPARVPSNALHGNSRRWGAKPGMIVVCTRFSAAGKQRVTPCC